MMKQLSTAQLEKLRDYWQQVLRLQDWDIIIKIKRGYEMGNDCGNVNYQGYSKKAIINLLDPDDYSNEDFAYDIEETLVHELLHLRFSGAVNNASDGSASSNAEEIAIDQTAEAFVELHTIISDYIDYIKMLENKPKPKKAKVKNI